MTKRRAARLRDWFHALTLRFKVAAGLLVTVLSLIAAYRAFDLHYAKSEDLRNWRSDTMRDLAELRQEVRGNKAAQEAALNAAVLRVTLQSEVALLEQRKKEVDDSVFDLRTKRSLVGPKFVVADQIALERYANEANEIAGLIRQKNRTLENMRAGK